VTIGSSSIAIGDMGQDGVGITWTIVKPTASCFDFNSKHHIGDQAKDLL
jgi:hypothetical protein